MQVDFTLAHLFKRVVAGVVVGIDGCGQTGQGRATSDWESA